MNGFSGLSYTEISNIADQLSTKSETMRNLLEGSIKTEMNKVGTDGVWSGDAAEQAKAEFNELAAKFESFYTAIKACSTYLKNTVERYQSVDSAVQNAVGR